MLLYFLYVKLVHCDLFSIILGLHQLTHDNVTEHPDTINILERMNIYQEVILSIMYRILPIKVKRWFLIWFCIINPLPAWRYWFDIWFSVLSWQVIDQILFQSENLVQSNGPWTSKIHSNTMYSVSHTFFIMLQDIDLITLSSIMTPPPLLHNDAFWRLWSTSVVTVWLWNVCIRLNKICIQYEKDICKNIWLKIYLMKYLFVAMH